AADCERQIAEPPVPAVSVAELPTASACNSTEAPTSDEENDGGSDRGEAEEKPLEKVAFEWSGFRDRRLGRLVADFRYNFAKAAVALSEEFSSDVSVEDCRRRYGELIRPAQKTDSQDLDSAPKHDHSGRAKDGPPPDPKAVQEVSDWWVRRLVRGPRADEVTSSSSSAAAKASEVVPNENLAEESQALPVPVRHQHPASPWDSLVQDHSSHHHAAESPLDGLLQNEAPSGDGEDSL
ncbi:unnamed protein product, partial [Polarella glacialis]